MAPCVCVCLAVCLGEGGVRRYHRDVAEVVLDHEGHGVYGGMVGIDGHQLAALRHDVGHPKLGGRLVAHCHLGEVICSQADIFIHNILCVFRCE